MPNTSTLRSSRYDAEEPQREGRWTREEHDQFIIAFEKYGKDWRSIAKFLKTRTNIQCRTHAQKYFGAELATYVHAPKPKPSSKMVQFQQQQHATVKPSVPYQPMQFFQPASFQPFNMQPPHALPYYHPPVPQQFPIPRMEDIVAQILLTRNRHNGPNL
ncbi:hypothetical protein BASA81_006417 [Batrachochytrium salamandrivorans]|nr:hypothetical protein BASA81_006417 [Batrachochytrium salamandrivorans]